MNTLARQQTEVGSSRLGVTMTRRDGEPRRRFSDDELLAVLDSTAEEIKKFVQLFAPRQKPYLIQRADGHGQRGPWATVSHPLPDNLIIRHLLANQLSGAAPLWIGTFAWDKSRFVAIDVDLKADGFGDRCQLVESTLYRLGIHRDHWLIQTSPSGGRHYYFFSHDPIPTDEIRPIFEKAGLVHRPGLHEVYPSQSHGFRLPFGWVPSVPHDPSAWVAFIRAYEAGKVPLVNWKRCKKRAASYVAPQLPAVKLANLPSRSASVPAKAASRRKITSERPRDRCVESSTAVALRKVGPDQLLKRGIQSPGERRSLTKSIAWHLIFVRNMSQQEAGDLLVEWVYRTGQHASTDVRCDLLHGTSRVAQDTRSIVAYYARLAPTQSIGGKAKFAPSEINHLIQLVRNGPAGDRPARLRFALDFLNFAKNSTRPVAEGWECCPAVRGIIRNWHGCSGMRYKPHMQWALESGLIKLTRKKRQSSNGTGRARTFQVCVPRVPAEDLTMSYSAALRYVSDQGCRIPDRRRTRHGSSPSRPQSDTYGFSNVSRKGRVACSRATDRATESIEQVTEVMHLPCRPSQRTSPDQGATANHFPPQGALNAARTTNLCDAGGCRDNQHTAHRPPVPQRQHPSSPHGHLAARSAQRAHESDAISRLLHSPIGQRNRHLERASGYATSIGDSTLRASPSLQARDGTLPLPDGLPDPADDLGITKAVARLKAAAAAVYLLSTVEQWPVWSAIEAMARDPSYPSPQRRILLANPTTLTHHQVCQRNRLILEWRRRQNE